MLSQGDHVHNAATIMAIKLWLSPKFSLTAHNRVQLQEMLPWTWRYISLGTDSGKLSPKLWDASLERNCQSCSSKEWRLYVTYSSNYFWHNPSYITQVYAHSSGSEFSGEWGILSQAAEFANFCRISTFSRISVGDKATNMAYFDWVQMTIKINYYI